MGIVESYRQGGIRRIWGLIKVQRFRVSASGKCVGLEELWELREMGNV